MESRLVLFPIPLQGHLTPMLQLANILHSKGFSISIIHTLFNSPNPANYPHFSFHPIPETLVDCKTSVEDIVGLLNTFNVSCVAPFKDLLTQIVSENAVGEEPVACLITDVMWHFTQDVADSLKLPRIGLRTSNLSAFVAFSYSAMFREKGYLSSQGSQSEEIVPELPPLKIKDIPRFCKCEPEVYCHLICNMIEKSKASAGLIFNTFKELEVSELAMIQQDFSIPIFTVGPFHKQVPALSSSLLTQERDCISWLNAQAPKSVLYISFGSIAGLEETEFLEIAWGLADSQQPFLWAIRPGLVRGIDGLAPLPNGFSEATAKRGRIITWAPQEEVLSHPAVGGFWTHCGWNSTLESICEGVPMLCLPSFGDQMGNARYVSDVWKVGSYFENGLKREHIEKAIKRLMVENEGKEMRQRSVCLKEKASLAVSAGGSSHKSLETLIAYILSFEHYIKHHE